MSKIRRPERDHRAGEDLRVVAARDVAVVARVALDELCAPGSPAIFARFSRWCTARRMFGDDLRVALVGDVDDPRGADLRPVGGDGVVVLGAGELVDLGQVGAAADRDRLGDLRDRALRPVELGDLLELRALLARLDLARVEDEQALAGGDVGAVAVVGDRQAVRVVVRGRDDHRQLRVGDVDRGDVARADRGRVERVAVGREAGLVAEDADRQRALQHRVAAVLVEVVEVDDPGIERGVAGDRGEQAAALVEQQRLVRGLHRGREQRSSSASGSPGRTCRARRRRSGARRASARWSGTAASCRSTRTRARPCR